MSTAKKTAVKFLKGWRGYNTDEIAGFEDNVARRLVKEGVAEELEEAGADAAAVKSAATKAGAASRKAPAKSKSEATTATPTVGSAGGDGAQQQGGAGDGSDPGGTGGDGAGQTGQQPGDSDERP